MDGSSSSVPGSSLVILSVSVVGILATSLLLLAYYLFLTRCGLLFFWRSDHLHHVHVVVQQERRSGLEEAAIRRMPTFRYRNNNNSNNSSSAQDDCAVCLAEFRDGERLRLLPPCLHAFHIDCIDAWLQATANCPLCRATVVDAPSLQHHMLGGRQDRRATDVDDIVIDIITSSVDADPEAPAVAPRTERDKQRTARVPSGVQQEELCCMGLPQPMRRSLSMDSCNDKRFYLALQQHHQRSSPPAIPEDQAGRSSRLRRSFFSFSQSRSPRSSATILPL